ncbi:MAG TPA: ribbon-helix-helix protein, CopG family [Thermomicrobiaceae bacterium]|nr:ribbon-helix-helix protein, CopG family [Thermomicrobiaceae bacterium]
MQLNIYVPKEKAAVVEALEEAARRTGRPKNELVLEALDDYLRQLPHRLEVVHLGEVRVPERDELYLEPRNR